MATPHFLVTALVLISHSVTVDSVVIFLWRDLSANSDQCKPISRNTEVYLRCSNFFESGEFRWTFIRPGDHVLKTTFSDYLKITTFNESHVGNYQCRVFLSSGNVMWRSITLCLAKNGTEKRCDKENVDCPLEMSTGVQVIKFNLLQRSRKALEPWDNADLIDLATLQSREEILYLAGATVSLECPFKKTKDSSLIWMVDRMLKYKMLKVFNKPAVNILKVKRKGQYDCLVGNSSGYVRHRFIMKTGGTGIDTKAHPRDIDVKLLISISCVIILFFVATAALFFRLRKSKRVPVRRHIPSPQRRMAADLTTRPISYLDLLDTVKVSQSAEICSKSDVKSTAKSYRNIYENSTFTPWKLCLENLQLGEVLRENNFYMLYRARLVNVSRERSINVVVKMSKAGTTDNHLMALVSEMDIMKSVGKHTNVIGLLGTCTQTEALFFVMEYAQHGNLQDYLREWGSTLEHECIDECETESGRLPVHIDLVSYAHQVAMGMNHLASRGCVHKGLQAKRVLISKGNILKIADYATKSIHCKDFSTVARDNNQSSVRWMAPETLFRGIHSTEANVWSYGIVLWEIMTFAATPYPLILTTEELTARLKLGYYMENPSCCPKDIYKLMRRCWNEKPSRRPRFDQLVEDLDEMLQNLSNQVKRLESGNYQQEEYAVATCEPLRKLNYNTDDDYDDVIHLPVKNYHGLAER